MMIDFELAKDKVLMGAERKSLILSDAEKRNTAFHEAGHTLVAAMLLGMTEVVVSRLVDPILTLAADFVIFLSVLLVRPAGLFGRAA